MGMSAVKAEISNALWEISLIPTGIELQARARLYAYREKKNSEEIRKKMKMEKKQEEEQKKEQLKKASKASTASDSLAGKVGDEIDIASKDNDFMKIMMMEKAISTNKWLDYAFYYMTDSDAILVKAEPGIREFINGVAALFDFGKIYESADVMDLNTCEISNKNFNPNTNFIISIDEIKKIGERYAERIAERKEQLAAEKEHPEDDSEENTSFGYKPKFVEDESKIIHPISFFKMGPSEPLPLYGEGITDEMIDSINKTLVPLLEGMEYRFALSTTDSHLVDIYIKRNIVEDCYTIDPDGSVMGLNKMYLFAPIPNDHLPVSVIDHPDIIKRVFDTAFYVMTPEEIQSVLVDHFYNMGIYRYVDMSNTGFLSKLSTEDFQKLGKKLTFIINKCRDLYNPNGEDVPRFRFKEFESIDKFSIISDSEVISPLSVTNETSVNITEGLTFEVEKDKVLQKLRDITISYEIEQYGDL